MLATATDVLDITGYSADDTDIKKAQAIIEVFAGRLEALITDADDLGWMRYAVAWQVAYMSSDAEGIYEQANVQRFTQNETSITIGKKNYAISPLAERAVSRLSWNRSRSISTAPFGGGIEFEPWEVV